VDLNVRDLHLNYHHKLRTYMLIKNNFKYKGMELYLKYIDCRRKYSLLARLRMGVLPIRIESGRYELAASRSLNVENRICRCCVLCKIEDEIHFLLECPFYIDLRKELFNVCERYIKNFIITDDINVVSLFCKILNSDKREVIFALANFVWRAYCKRFKHLEAVLTN